jgi:hypothetical protein
VQRNDAEERQIARKLKTKQEKITELEDVCLKQQHLIEKLEKIVNAKSANGQYKSWFISGTMYKEDVILYRASHGFSSSLVGTKTVF